MYFRSYFVQHEFPLRAAYFRQDLPHVAGFPHLRVLRLIRLPISIRRLFPYTVIRRRPVHVVHVNAQVSALSVSGFPLTCLNSCIPSSNNSPHREPMRPPGFSDVSLPACHGLMTPTDLHTQAITGDLVLPSVFPKTLGIRIKLIYYRSCTSTSGSTDSPTAYRILCLRFGHIVRHHSMTPQWTQDSIRAGG